MLLWVGSWCLTLQVSHASLIVSWPGPAATCQFCEYHLSIFWTCFLFLTKPEPVMLILSASSLSTCFSLCRFPYEDYGVCVKCLKGRTQAKETWAKHHRVSDFNFLWCLWNKNKKTWTVLIITGYDWKIWNRLFWWGWSQSHPLENAGSQSEHKKGNIRKIQKGTK